jgi:YHS domain-containing protein
MKHIITLTSIALFSVSCTREETVTTETTPETTAVTAATPYPLDVCLVSGEKLGSMGEPIVITHEGREIKFCCDQCLPSFNENPDKYLSKLPQ